jgi:hypothetical protein
MSGYSPAPGTPQTSDKAIWSAVVGFLVAVGGYYVADDDPFTRKELVEAFLLGLIATGLTGGVTFAVKNKPKRR